MTRSYFAIVGRLKFGYNLTHKFKQRPSPTTIIIFFAGIVTVLDIWPNRAEIILLAIQNQKECFRQLDHPNVKFYARPDFSKIKIHWLLQKYPVQSTNGFTFTPYMYAHTHTKENDFKCRYQNLQPIKGFSDKFPTISQSCPMNSWVLHIKHWTPLPRFYFASDLQSFLQ